MTVSFATFDPAQYQSAPRLSAEGLIALSRALVNAQPSNAPAHAATTGSKLKRLLSEAESALTARRREVPVTDVAAEVALDAATDGLWAALRDRLDAWTAFEHPALDTLLPKGKSKASPARSSLATARKRAVRARKLAERVFGGEGLAFLRLPFAEQAEATAAVLRLLEEDDLVAELQELAGEELVSALFLVQERYEAMVAGRAVREQTRTVDLGELRNRLLRAISAHASAWLSTVDEDEPASLETAVAALTPIAVARSRASRNGAGAASTANADTAATASTEGKAEA